MGGPWGRPGWRSELAVGALNRALRGQHRRPSRDCPSGCWLQSDLGTRCERPLLKGDPLAGTSLEENGQEPGLLGGHKFSQVPSTLVIGTWPVL